MALTLYNSLSRNKEKFVPIEPGRVHMYVCGPTVYDYPHIGHAKSYIAFDILNRYLRFSGYRVRYVQNITDVGHLLDSGEDRILRGAEREKIEPMELVERYTAAYFRAMDALHVLRPDISPHAAAHVPEQIELVGNLLERGFAYVVNGSVYFDVEKWPAYGKLSGRRIDDQQAGARLEVNPEKRHPADFALWKKAEPEHLMQWNSPWGRGFPGWHIECSTMAMKYLGETIDIHGGGMENKFPHHDCEIAQSEAATGKPFAKYWIHNNMVLVDGVKMSKSLGNFTTISEALNKFTGEQLRFFILQTHYRSPVDFTDAAVSAAAQGLERLRGTRQKLEDRLAHSVKESGDAPIEWLAQFRQRFIEAMDDDLNTSLAIGVLFDFSREINKLLDSEEPASVSVLRQAKELLETLAGTVLGLPLTATERGMSAAPFIELLIELRNSFRHERNWSRSDWVRDELQSRGVVLEDGKESTLWRFEKI
ncbi:MAG TPA: cysteine--tRNA ligase [bacterium]|nr:cysteine--tRNA ligase [bacterium]HNT65320.1 cysteine--tRNA ligase [bacterium]